MNVQLDKLIEIAEYLEEPQACLALIAIKKREEEKTVYLPVVGQFSAGKSKLINNLLGRELLPVKGTEATAYITSISYGKESAGIICGDGVLTEIGMEELKALNQSELAGSVWAARDIRSVWVKAECPVLENGLTLIDTPGVNTIINKHEALTYSILNETYFLIYVLAKAATLTDLDILKEIKRLGIRLCFVRTKLDEINESEESVSDAINEDINRLRTELNEEPVYFPITNNTDLLGDDFWRGKFNKLYDFLKNTAADRKELKTGMSGRINAIQAELKARLTRKLNLTQALSRKTDEEIASRIEAVTERQEKFLREGRIISMQIKNSIEPLRLSLLSDIAELREGSINEFAKKMEEHQTTEEAQLAAEGVFKACFEKILKYTASMLTEKVKNWINSSYSFYDKSVQGINDGIFGEAGSDISFNLSSIDLRGFSEDIMYLREQLTEDLEEISELIRKNERSLKELAVIEKEVESAYYSLKENTEEAEDNLRGLGKYEERKILVPGKNNVSRVMKKIGTAADWAMFFLSPEAAIEDGVQVLNMMPGNNKGISQADKKPAVSKQSIKTADIIKDGLYLSKNLVDLTEEEREQPTLLDYFTFEYHFQNIGRKFDIPAKFITDKEHEREYREKRKQLEEIYWEQKIKELDELEALQIIKTKEERLKKEIELNEKYKKKLENRLQMEEKNIIKTANERAKGIYITSCEREYEKRLREYFEKLTPKINSSLDGIAEDVIGSASIEIMKKLEEAKSELEAAQRQRETGEYDYKNTCEIIKSYLEVIEG